MNKSRSQIIRTGLRSPILALDGRDFDDPNFPFDELSSSLPFPLISEIASLVLGSRLYGNSGLGSRLFVDSDAENLPSFERRESDSEFMMVIQNEHAGKVQELISARKSLKSAQEYLELVTVLTTILDNREVPDLDHLGDFVREQLWEVVNSIKQSAVELLSRTKSSKSIYNAQGAPGRREYLLIISELKAVADSTGDNLFNSVITKFLVNRENFLLDDMEKVRKSMVTALNRCKSRITDKNSAEDWNMLVESRQSKVDQLTADIEGALNTAELPDDDKALLLLVEPIRRPLSEVISWAKQHRPDNQVFEKRDDMGHGPQD